MRKTIKIVFVFLSLCNTLVAQSYDDTDDGDQHRKNADSCYDKRSVGEDFWRCALKDYEYYTKLRIHQQRVVEPYVEKNIKELRNMSKDKKTKGGITHKNPNLTPKDVGETYSNSSKPKEVIKVKYDTIYEKETVYVNNVHEEIVTDTIINTISDTIYIMPEPNLCHPLGINSWTINKTQWKWISVGVGTAGAAIGTYLFFEADKDNFEKHENAKMYTESRRYYNEYKDNHQFNTIWGPMISIAGGALVSYVLYNWHSSVYILPKEANIFPYADMQGNLGLSMSFNF